MIENIEATYHARLRQAQRNLSDQDVEFCLSHGHRVYGSGVLYVFLGRRDIPADKTTYRRFAHLEGSTLVFRVHRASLVLITVYRSNRRSGLRAIQKKAFWNPSHRPQDGFHHRTVM